MIGRSENYIVNYFLFIFEIHCVLIYKRIIDKNQQINNLYTKDLIIYIIDIVC